MKRILPAIQMALRALRSNRLRSALTMLGIVIGVAAVIATVAVGTGATQRVQDQIASIGSNLIVVMSGSISTNGIRLGAGNAATLTEDDAVAIGRECPAVAVAAATSRGGAQVVAGNNNWATSIMGTTPGYLTIRDLSMAQGRAFTDADVDGATKVALLGKTVADTLFPGADPVDQVIRIKNVPFIVIGVLAPKGQSPMGQDQDDVILMPITTAKKRVIGVNKANAASVQSVLVQGRGSAEMKDAEAQINDLLRQRHHLQTAQENDFSVRNLEEVFSAQEASARVLSFLLAAVASVSLIVGGIGIMNIMLVSVTERTREIGLRQAVGAKTHDILTQFLVEAVTLSLAGGIVGILVGSTASWAIARLADWATSITPTAIVLAFVFSALVGVFFGYYPARKAAFLDPIDALRYE